MPDLSRRRAIQYGLTHLLMPTGAFSGLAAANNEAQQDKEANKKPRSNHLTYTAGGAGAGYMVGRALRASMHINDSNRKSN
jgi:hypothetical protein